jgi:hypothetical protein
MMRALVLALMLLPLPAHALEIDARLPMSYGELIVVRNDGGIRNATDYFGTALSVALISICARGWSSSASSAIMRWLKSISTSRLLD